LDLVLILSSADLHRKSAMKTQSKLYCNTPMITFKSLKIKNHPLQSVSPVRFFRGILFK